MTTIQRYWSQFAAWFGQQAQGTRIGLGVGAGCLALIVVCCACAGGIGLLGNLSGGGGNSTGQRHATATRRAATQAPTATATPVVILASATLGGRESDFQARYGSPTLSASDVRHYAATIAGNAVEIVVTLNAAKPSGVRVSFIHLTPPDTTTVWTSAQAQAIMPGFLPADAKYQRTINVQDIGPEKLYLSANLAQVFPSSSFTDSTSSAQDAPGTFYVVCGGQAEDQGGCTINLGS